MFSLFNVVRFKVSTFSLCALMLVWMHGLGEQWSFFIKLNLEVHTWINVLNSSYSNFPIQSIHVFNLQFLFHPTCTFLCYKKVKIKIHLILLFLPQRKVMLSSKFYSHQVTTRKFSALIDWYQRFLQIIFSEFLSF